MNHLPNVGYSQYNPKPLFIGGQREKDYQQTKIFDWVNDLEDVTEAIILRLVFMSDDVDSIIRHILLVCINTGIT